MNKELMELIDAAMEPLERFRFARKGMVAAALAEAASELLNDGYDDVLANSIIRDLKHKEILRRGQESLAMRNLVDRLYRAMSDEDPSFSAIVDSETNPGKVPDLSQHDHDTEPVLHNPRVGTSEVSDHRDGQAGRS
jgi:hypothetical protein